jgi:hypothetical protein
MTGVGVLALCSSVGVALTVVGVVLTVVGVALTVVGVVLTVVGVVLTVVGVVLTVVGVALTVVGVVLTVVGVALTVVGVVLTAVGVVLTVVGVALTVVAFTLTVVAVPLTMGAVALTVVATLRGPSQISKTTKPFPPASILPRHRTGGVCWMVCSARRSFPDLYGGIEAPEGPEHVARGQSARGAATPGTRDNNLISSQRGESELATRHDGQPPPR